MYVALRPFFSYNTSLSSFDYTLINRINNLIKQEGDKVKTSLFIFVFLLISQFTLASNNWVVSYIGQPNNLKGVFFVNTQTGYIVGQGIIAKTTNSGNNWSITQTRYNLKEVYFLNDQTGFAAGKTNDSGFVLKTVNGGATWTTYFLGMQPSSFDLRKIFFKNSDTGYIVREANGYYRTTNGGALWTQKSFDSFERIRDLVLKGSTYYKIGSRDIGGYYKPAYWSSTDEENWGNRIECDECENNELGLTMDFGDTTNYLISEGGQWRLRRSTSQFPGWTSIAGSSNGYSNYFVNSINIHWGYSQNPKSFIQSSSNAGYSWVRDTINDFLVTKIFFVNNSLGFAISLNGLIAKTENGGGTIGILPISNSVPKNYSLSQNYPNPFNPSTNIIFDITKKGFVRLIVFDVLGNELSILVNQDLQVGTYKADWNARNYPSGIYLYRIEVADYTETKKMVLVK